MFLAHAPLQEQLFAVEQAGVYVYQVDPATGQALTALQGAPPLEALLTDAMRVGFFKNHASPKTFSGFSSCLLVQSRI